MKRASQESTIAARLSKLLHRLVFTFQLSSITARGTPRVFRTNPSLYSGRRGRLLSSSPPAFISSEPAGSIKERAVARKPDEN